MSNSVSPNFPYAGKGTFDIQFTEFYGFKIPDKVVIYAIYAARLGFGSIKVATFIVYGDIENGSFQLASDDGVPMGLVTGEETPRDKLNAEPFECQHLEKTTTFATIHVDHTKQSTFGPSFNCNNQGILSCLYPVMEYDAAALFIVDKPPPKVVFDLFFAFKQTVPGLSTIKSKGGPGCDLSYVDLTNAELSGVDLTGANLQQANLTGAKLIGAKLDGADLSGANLGGATLSTDLTKAIFNAPPIFSTDPNNLTSFKNAKLNYSLIGLNWSCLDLTGASVVGMPADLTNLKAAHLTALRIDLSGKKLVNAVFTNATLTGANLTGAILDGTDLSGAKLEGATLSADLTKAIFNTPPIFSTNPNNLTSFKDAKLKFSLIGLNWSCLDLTGAAVVGMPVDLTNLKAAHLTALGIDLSQKTLVGADFSYAKLANSFFNGAVLTGAVFTGADLSGAKLLNGTQLGGAHLDMANLSGADLTGAQLIGVTGVAASLTYAFLSTTCFDKADLKGVDFSGATLIETSMQDTTSLERARFTGAYLNTVKFQGKQVNLRGANFANACLINCQLTQANLGPSGDSAATMLGAFLQGANLSGVILTSANLYGAVVAFDPGRIDVSYCDSDHKKTDPWRTPYPATQTDALEESIKAGNCTCPNGKTYSINFQEGLTFKQMCHIEKDPTCWTPDRCKP